MSALQQELFIASPGCETESLPKFPSTRYQGSKRKLLPQLHEVFVRLNFSSALDLYSGTGMVSLLLAWMGKTVHANDFLLFNQNAARVFLESRSGTFDVRRFDTKLRYALCNASLTGKAFVSENFHGVFFLDDENLEIDRFCQNLDKISDSEIERATFVYCVGQALLMKRPYNLFHRANLDMRTRDVPRSFGNAKTWETSTLDHAVRIYKELAAFPFKQATDHVVSGHDATVLSHFNPSPDLVYLDPPYLNSRGQNPTYSSFYHFLDGLCDYSLFSNPDERYAYKPIVQFKNAWSTEAQAELELRQALEKWPSSVVVLSYRGDGKPTEDVLMGVFNSTGRRTSSFDDVAYKYALSRSEGSQEKVFISLP